MAAHEEPLQLVQKKQREINWLYTTPMFLMVLPLIRIVFRKQPVLRNRLFYGGIAVGLIHGTWLIARPNTPEDGHELEQFYTPPSAVNSPKRAAPKFASDPQLK